MKRKIQILMIGAAICALGIALFWPKSVRLIGIDGVDVAGLHVSILRDSTWDNSIADNEGRVDFGRGLWRTPWKNTKKLVIVYDEDKVYLESSVQPDYLGTIELELTEGKERKDSENFKEDKSAD